MRAAWFFIALTLVLCAWAPSEAKVYQYFDEEGTLIVTDGRQPRAGQHQKPRGSTHSETLAEAYRPLDEELLTYEFYDVGGSSIHEVIKSTETLGPYDTREKERFAAQTRWTVGWSYEYEYSYEDVDGRLLANVIITDVAMWPNLTVKLPTLARDVVLPAADAALWEKFISGVLQHEHDHVRLVRDNPYWEEAEARMKALKTVEIPHGDRRGISKLVSDAVKLKTSQIGKALVMSIGWLNDEYDRVTEHGVKHWKRTEFFQAGAPAFSDSFSGSGSPIR